MYWFPYKLRTFSFAFGVELDYRCWRKCFISPISPIKLNTKNKLTVLPQFRFCFCCYHHPIFWKFVTLFLMGKKSYFFFDCTGRSVKGGGKERKIGLCCSVCRGVPGALRGFYFISMVAVETRTMLTDPRIISLSPRFISNNYAF